MTRTAGVLLALLALLIAFAFPPAPAAAPATPPLGGAAPGDSIRHVILISVDGLRPDAISSVPSHYLPNFHRLRAEAAFTDNARTDDNFSVTLPNHIAQLTGLPVTGPNGHGWTDNSDPVPGATLHSNRGAYIPSVFDVAHDAGLSTAAYVSKSKFSLLDVSYGPDAGAPDVTGEDNGRDKLDIFFYEGNTKRLVRRFTRDLADDPANFTFLHLRDPDASGHIWGWSLSQGSAYMRAVRKVDALLGQVLDAVERDPELRKHTAIILTADHGGSGRHHDDRSDPADYTVPFYVWGAAVEPADLYEINALFRRNPGDEHPPFDGGPQPIRNGDAANLALRLLGLPPIPGSLMNRDQSLGVSAWPATPAFGPLETQVSGRR